MVKKKKSQHKSAQKSETKNKTNITKISAKTAPQKSDQSPKVQTAEKSTRNTEQPEKPLRKVFILARPFVAIGRYLRDSWRELRLVRWPSRANTWKMTLAVLIYCAIFIVFIILIDSFFTFIFNILLGQQ